MVIARPVASVLAGCLMGGSIAHAELPTVTDNPPQPESDTASAAETQLEEVIVTANRRQESSQRVPLRIPAISGEDAQRLRVTDAQSLAALVPGHLFNRQP